MIKKSILHSAMVVLGKDCESYELAGESGEGVLSYFRQ